MEPTCPIGDNTKVPVQKWEPTFQILDAPGNPDGTPLGCDTIASLRGPRPSGAFGRQSTLSPIRPRRSTRTWRARLDKWRSIASEQRRQCEEAEPNEVGELPASADRVLEQQIARDIKRWTANHGDCRARQYDLVADGGEDYAADK